MGEMVEETTGMVDLETVAYQVLFDGWRVFALFTKKKLPKTESLKISLKLC